MTTARKKAPGAAAKVGGSMRSTAAQMMMKNRDEEFNEKNEYINGLQAKLRSFANISDQVAQGRFCKFYFLFLSSQKIINLQPRWVFS